jgi:hypothetical protein
MGRHGAESIFLHTDWRKGCEGDRGDVGSLNPFPSNTVRRCAQGGEHVENPESGYKSFLV